MSHHRLSECGLYRQTIEAMLYGAPIAQDVQKQFNDSVLERKERKVNDLVKKFEKNMKLDELTVEIEEDKESEAKFEVQPAKPGSAIPSMEQFVQGILRSSSPIPQARLEEEYEVQLQETPILPFQPVRRELDFEILDNVPSADITKSFRPTLKSEGRAKVAEAKGYSTPKFIITVHKESSDSAYFSAGSSTTTPAQTKEQEPDIYMKFARAKLHEQIKKYSTWKAHNLRCIATSVSSMRLSALKKAVLACPNTQLMIQIYEKCASGEDTKELDIIVVSIFDLLDQQVHVERISVLEEYVVMKYCKKMMK